MSIGTIVSVVGLLIIAYVFWRVFPPFRAYRERKQVHSAFSQYLSPELVEQLTEDPDRIEIGGETRNISSMLCGIKAYPDISGGFGKDLQGLAAVVNRFYSKMVPEIMSREGTVDYFFEGKISAMWNAPIDTEDHPAAACQSALAMLGALQDLNKELETEGVTIHGIPLRITVGIGLDVGDCTVGNIGSEQRFDYGAIGSPVFMAKEFQNLAVLRGLPTLVGEGIKDAVPDFAFLEVDRISMEDVDDDMPIFALLGDKDVRDSPAFCNTANAQAKFLSAFDVGDMDGARNALQGCRAAAEEGLWDLSRLHDHYESQLA